VSVLFCFLFVFVLCLVCRFLWIVHSWLPLRFSLTFIGTGTSRKNTKQKANPCQWCLAFRGRRPKNLSTETPFCTMKIINTIQPLYCIKGNLKYGRVLLKRNIVKITKSNGKIVKKDKFDNPNAHIHDCSNSCAWFHPRYLMGSVLFCFLFVFVLCLVCRFLQIVVIRS
jgi:hypothetical protein